MIQCKGYRSAEGDYDCGHPRSGHICCEECVCNGGLMSPISGKRFRGDITPYIMAAEERRRGIEHGRFMIDLANK